MPAVGTIAARFRERDRRHVPPQVQLVITIHRQPVPAEGLAAYSRNQLYLVRHVHRERMAMLVRCNLIDCSEHVAAHAGVGKATIYRRWPSKEALALDLLMQLAAPHIAIEDIGDTRAELLAAVTNAMRAVTDTPFGPVIRALLSQIAINPVLGDPFRASVVQARRDEVARVIIRGVSRGDLRSDADSDVATELLVGPVYFRLMFGGELTQDFAERVVDSALRGYAKSD